MDAVPPKISRSNSKAYYWVAGMVLGAVGVGGATMIYFFNPTTTHIYPVCEFHQVTGLNCPGCGATRGVYALLHGHFLKALHDNALFVLLLPMFALRGIWFAWEKLQGRTVSAFIPVNFLWLFLFVALAFGVLRNLPDFSFLSPG